MYIKWCLSLIFTTILLAQSNILDDFELKTNMPKAINHLSNFFVKAHIEVCNNGEKEWDYVQVYVIFPKGIHIDGKNEEIHKKSWTLRKVMPKQKRKIYFKIRNISIGEDWFICKIKLIAKTKPNYLAITELITTHIGYHGVNPIFKYETEDPVFVNETTTYVLEISLSEARRYSLRDKSIFLVSKIDSKMKFIKAKAATEYWYDSEKKMVVFAPLKITDGVEKITCEITCEAIQEGHSLHTFLIWDEILNRFIVLEEPTSIVK